MNREETEMISRCQQGDQEALKEIFDKYHKKVYSIAYGVVRQREEALDVVQDVFIKLFRSIKNFKGRSNFYTYLYRMVMNTAIDHKRKAGKQFMSSLDVEGSFEPSDEPEKGPEKVLLQKELEERVRLAGLSYQEMAEAMGCSIGTVMSRLHYGRKRMQESLKDYVKLPGQSRGVSTVSGR
ncbi:MAG: polymerase sigma factor RpoE [Deltaproteobacteria bacterium]|nr:polymerase sigma factor RpoE [Deltaproteobacteria bacterium]